MIDCTLAWTLGAPELLIILIISGIPFALIVLAAKYLLRQKRENIRLRLEVGKLADFVVLDRNPLKVEHDSIKDIRVLATVLGRV